MNMFASLQKDWRGTKDCMEAGKPTALLPPQPANFSDEKVI